MNELHKLDFNIFNLDEISLIKLLLYGNNKYEKAKTKQEDILSFYKFHPFKKAI